jgi:hypothetical protein
LELILSVNRNMRRGGSRIFILLDTSPSHLFLEPEAGRTLLILIAIFSRALWEPGTSNFDFSGARTLEPGAFRITPRRRHSSR